MPVFNIKRDVIGYRKFCARAKRAICCAGTAAGSKESGATGKIKHDIRGDEIAKTGINTCIVT